MAFEVAGQIKLLATERTGPAFRGAMRNMKTLAQEVNSSGRVVERSTSRMHSGMTRFMSFLGQQLTGVVRSFFYGLRMGVVGAGVAVSAFVVVSLKSFRDFDKKLRETTALIAGANRSGGGSISSSFKEAQKSYKDFYSYLLKTAPQMRRTPQEMAGGLYELVQAGLNGPQAKRLLKPAALGATAGNSDVGSSSRVLVQIMNALRMGTTKKGSGKQAQSVMDQLFQAINLGVGVEFPTLSTGIGKFIGSAGVTFKGGRKGGLDSLKQLMATYVFSTQQGARVQDVGVGIQDVIKTIANPSVKSAKFAKKIGLGDLGSTFLQQHGFVGALTTIIQKMKDAGYTGAKLNDAIGRLFSDVRGRRIAAYATNAQMVTQALKDMGAAGGAVNRSFKEQGRSMDAALQTFKSYYEVTKIALGGAAAPYVTRGASFLQGIMGDAGVFGPGQDIADKASNLHGSKRTKYINSLSSKQHVEYDQAQKFNRADFGGKIKIIADTALTNFRAWWSAPQTQAKFTSMVHSMIQRSFSILGRMIKTIPSIYQFGRRIAGEVLRGVTDGFKNTAKNFVSRLTGGGGGGGGGLPSGNPLGGISKDPFQAIAMGLLGLTLAGSKRGGSPLARGGMMAAGATLAGLPPGVAALLALGGTGATFAKNRRLRMAAEGKGGGGGAGGGAGAEMIGTMRVQAGTVYINGGVAGGGGGGGGVPSALPPGYTRTKTGKLKFKGRWASEAQMTSALDAEDVMAAYLPGAAPEASGPGRFRRLGSGFKGLAGNRAVKGGGLALANAGATIAMGGNIGSAVGTGVGALGFLVPGAGPALGFATMAAGGLLGGYLGDKFFGSKAAPTANPTQTLIQQIMAPIGPGPVPNLPPAPKGKHPHRGRVTKNPLLDLAGAKNPRNTVGQAGVGYGLRLGGGGGLKDWKGLAANPKLAFPKEAFFIAQEFARLLGKMAGTPLTQPDKMNAAYQLASQKAITQQASDVLESVAQDWMIKSENELDFDKILTRQGYGKKNAKGGSERPAPAFSGNHPRGKSRFTVDPLKPNLNSFTSSIWQTLNGGVAAKVKDKAGKTLDKVGKDPISSKNTPSFTHGLNAGLAQAQTDAPKKMHDLMQSYTQAALNMAGGATSGVTSSAPPTGGSRFNNGQQSQVNASGAAGAGDATSSAFGPAMMTAGGAMADKVSTTIAKAVSKKQLEGPIGNAMKGLAWLRQQVGKPYLWGGGHPPNLNLKAYDCSGLASSALMAMGSKLAGTTFSMLPDTAPGAGLVQLGFNDAHRPTHMGIGVMGQWFEARGHATPILGPGKARTKWPYVGTPKFHTGGVYDSHSVRGEGPAILKDGEMVVRSSADGGLKAHPVVSGGGFMVNGPLIAHAEIRSAHDIHHLAQELVDLLEKKRANSTTAGT